MVCEILFKIDRINFQRCIKIDDKGNQRDLNEEETKVLQNALDLFSNKVIAPHYKLKRMKQNLLDFYCKSKLSSLKSVLSIGGHKSINR